jgi:outer membrane protein assembly factor BamA
VLQSNVAARRRFQLVLIKPSHFSISGGYSTTDGALAEVSISERNFLGRGLFAKASVTYGQYARGASLRFKIRLRPSPS